MISQIQELLTDVTTLVVVVVVVVVVVNTTHIDDMTFPVFCSLFFSVAWVH